MDRRTAAGTPRRKLWWRVGRGLGLGLVLAYSLVAVAMMFAEESLVFFPSRYPEGLWTPAELQPEDAWFQAADGTRLHGWYVAQEQPRAVVLFCHGNGGNITHRAEILRILHDRVGVAVLIFDYRGYGRSAGTPNEAGVLQDARAARAWLAQRAGVAEKEIVLLGNSLGGGVAVDLAAKDGARALVLENTFTSLPDVAAHYYPWLPVRLLMRTRFDSLGKIGAYRGPLLQSHSEGDTLIPVAFARRLFAAANEPKQFVALNGLDHNDLQTPAYFDTLRQFLDAINTAEATGQPVHLNGP